MSISTAFLLILALITGGGIGFFLRKKFIEGNQADLEKQRLLIIENAIHEAEQFKKENLLQVKEEIYQAKKEAEQEIKNSRKNIENEQRRLERKLDKVHEDLNDLKAKEDALSDQEKKLVERERKVTKREEEVEVLIIEQRQRLEKIAGITCEEAKKLLLDSMESEARMDAAKRLTKIENEMKLEADRKGKNILALAIARYAGDYVADKTVSMVPLPNDEMKGRIIGREGRNIRAIEAATGIDIIIDDTPEAVILSGFNPIRREIARQSLLQLISDGRIHPARIEEVVAKVTHDLDVEIKEAGEKAAFDVGVHGIHVDLVNLIGRLKYRSSYGQNILQHSLEVAFLCGIMAAELGLDVKKAKRAGLLHDIGKAVDHEMEGSHAIIGRDLAKKYGERDEIVYAIAAHHEDLPPQGVLDILVQAADALSGARPGARKEMLQSYVKRLEDLENIANTFPGVEKSYAVQAGRDLRIVVNSQQVGDDAATLMSRDIAKAIEEQLTYPGQIRVTVIRETRAVEYAK
ncbi:ribonuclease Y [Candidatus Electronema sp. PJ]|uniref:ribonuclease Y n=1 Tax=Candidatus Electronema sp. PJ TaxID=3401572 RepID=UPI003AA9016E